MKNLIKISIIIVLFCMFCQETVQAQRNDHFNIMIGLKKYNTTRLSGRSFMVSWTSHHIPRVGEVEFLSTGGYAGLRPTGYSSVWGDLDVTHIEAGVLGSLHVMPLIEEIAGMENLLGGWIAPEVSLSAGYQYPLLGLYTGYVGEFDARFILAVEVKPTETFGIRLELNSPVVSPLALGLSLDF